MEAGARFGWLEPVDDAIINQRAIQSLGELEFARLALDDAHVLRIVTV
jgi:hypothetical protein